MKPLYQGFEWNLELIPKLWKVIDKIGKEKLKLTYYPPQFEVVTAEQMIDAYVSHGMPIYYGHWSFGKSFIQYQKAYQAGEMGLAYELVINSDPCIAYLMEDNTATMTALVMAHANCGHAHFFKNNYMFQQHTKPDAIIGFLEFAKKFIKECEAQYGEQRVGLFLDMVHYLEPYGVHRYKKPPAKKKQEMIDRQASRIKHEQESYDEIWETLPDAALSSKDIFERLEREGDYYFSESGDFLQDGINDENILYILEKNSICLKSWQREIIRIVRKISQYFYPQMQTKIMNEGWACFIHYHIMKEMYDMGAIDEGAYLEFLTSHVAVCAQYDMQNLNPYALGFAMFMDLKRACLTPDEEDYKWLPDIAGREDWMEALQEIVKYYKDESFVLQYLSPKVIKKFKLFSFSDNADEDVYRILGIQDPDDVMAMRRVLSKQTELDNYRPQLMVEAIDKLENLLYISYKPYKERGLSASSYFRLKEVLCQLWGGDVFITEDDDTDF